MSWSWEGESTWKKGYRDGFCDGLGAGLGAAFIVIVGIAYYFLS